MTQSWKVLSQNPVTVKRLESSTKEFIPLVNARMQSVLPWRNTTGPHCSKSFRASRASANIAWIQAKYKEMEKYMENSLASNLLLCYMLFPFDLLDLYGACGMWRMWFPGSKFSRVPKWKCRFGMCMCFRFFCLIRWQSHDCYSFCWRCVSRILILVMNDQQCQQEAAKNKCESPYHVVETCSLVVLIQNNHLWDSGVFQDINLSIQHIYQPYAQPPD